MKNLFSDPVKVNLEPLYTDSDNRTYILYQGRLIPNKLLWSQKPFYLKNRHKIKSIVFDMISVSINAVLLTFFPVYTVFILVTLNCLLIYPITRNYLKHRFEYEADNFAVESVSKKAVQHRLRRNSHLEPDNNGFIPYSTSHPEIKTRMDRVHNLDENTRN